MKAKFKNPIPKSQSAALDLHYPATPVEEISTGIYQPLNILLGDPKCVKSL